VTIDKSGSNLAALQARNAGRGAPIKIRQKKYLNNGVEQDHRAIKRRTRPMLGFENFRCARIIPGGIEFRHMIRPESPIVLPCGNTTGARATTSMGTLVRFVCDV